MASIILAIFGGLALLLTIVGLYAVVAFTVVQRTREIGVRLALGATRRDILGLVVRQGMRLTVAGVVFGLALAVPVAQALQSQLVGIGPTDVLSYAGSAVLLMAVGLTACLVPARRAAGLDPVRALRAE